MSLSLKTLSPAPGSKKLRKRVGRGSGSGSGKTCGRGHKGQRSRSGVSRAKLTSGQNPLHMQLPKSGFNTDRKTHAKLPLRVLAQLPEDVKEVTVENLIIAGVIKGYIKTIKLYRCGDVSRAFTIAKNIAITQGARAAIEAAKGKLNLKDRVL